MIKNLLFLFIGTLLITNCCFSQLSSTYQFSAVSGSYSAIAGTTITYTDGGFGVPTDEGYAAAIPIGFTFNYNGINYTTVNVSTNGFISFGGFTGVSYTNSLSGGPTTGRPILAALWDDMDNGGPSSYTTSGTAPNRVFTVQWTGVYWNWSAAATSMSFQIKLYETTNVIEFVYQQLGGAVEDPAGQGDLGASIGITATATGAGNYLSLSDASAAPTVSSTVATNSILTKPATGQIYRWTPWFYAHCPASANYTGPLLSEKISNFSFNTINNASTGQVGYQDFTNISTVVQPSTTYPFTVSLSNGWADDKVYIWIDFNHNGSFNDPGEQVYAAPSISVGPFSGNITIPATSANVLLGPTRLRIRLEDTGSPPTNNTPCGNSEYGQVEDYTVNIQNCTPLAITTQPPNTAICNGGNGTISIVVTGTTPTYQWQVSTNGGLNYTNLTNTAPYSGVNTATLNITGATLAMNGYLYRALMTNLCSTLLTSNAGTLSVNTAAAITTNPTNQTGCAGTTVNMNVVASGTGLSYQWQLSTDGGVTYNPVSGATSSTLTLTGISTSMNSNKYRAVVTSASCNSVTSSAATLSVNALPTVSIAAPVTAIRPGVSTTLTISSNPAGASYVWTFNGTTITGANASTLKVDVNGIGTYRATVTDVNGCQNTTSALVITAEPTEKLFIYPNPSTGRFQLRLYAQNLYDVRSVTIYNSAGVKVAEKDFNVNTRYDNMQFDLRHVAPGVYTIHIEHRYVRRRVVGQVVIVK